MNTWLQFLTGHGAQLSDSSFPGVRHFNSAPETSPPTGNFVAPLTDLGLIAFSGEDAAHFLHNQLTNDLQHLKVTQVRRAGYCTPKGRLLATFLIWKTNDVFVLQLPRQIQAAVQKRLQMFVLRAKVKSDDVTDSHVILGMAGAAAAPLLSKWFPALPSEPYAKADSDAGVLLRVDDALGAPRYQWITTQAVAESAWPVLTAALRPAGTGAWRLGDIYAGIPQITQATQERFVPQMVNFELVGGVSFKKGCYPGQEIVARSHYLGKLKRRMKLASIETQDAAPGMEVFSVASPEQACGMIVNAESVAPGKMVCLVELQTETGKAGPIRLGSASGAALQFEPLPYSIPDAA